MESKLNNSIRMCWAANLKFNLDFIYFGYYL